MAEPDPKKVFVVHGRNLAIRDAMFTFLRTLNLQPLEWSTIVKATGTAAPFVGDVLKKGFELAQATVVLFTPDDEACLTSSLRGHNEPTYEVQPTLQPRQNVLFEAGMSMALAPTRTVFVQCGELRPISDLAGIHAVRISNDSAARHSLMQRLRDAGCCVDDSGTHWLNHGDFAIAAASRSTSRDPQPGNIRVSGGPHAKIVSPQEGAEVADTERVEILVRDDHCFVVLIVHPVGNDQYWVQDPAQRAISKDGVLRWVTTAHFGRPGTEDTMKQFEMLAIVDPKEDLRPGQVTYSWPLGRAISETVTVTRR